MVWSQDNPFFSKEKQAKGIGGPHIGYDMIWPMSIIMRAFTADNDGEIRQCIRMLRDTDGGTGFMHESFHKDNPTKLPALVRLDEYLVRGIDCEPGGE